MISIERARFVEHVQQIARIYYEEGNEDELERTAAQLWDDLKATDRCMECFRDIPHTEDVYIEEGGKIRCHNCGGKA